MRISFGETKTSSLIAVPALVTLGVTLLRLVGELKHWSPVLFNRSAGGAFALIGIVWLIPVFGVYFAARLRRHGEGPASQGKAIGFAIGGILVFVGLALVTFTLPLNPTSRILAINIVAAGGAYVASRGWSQLAKAALAYGVAARIPVAAIMLIAISAGWGTHYELGPPNFPSMGVLATWFWIGLLPQLFFWIAFTVMISLLLGSLWLKMTGKHG
jgi:hypothetical protein